MIESARAVPVPIWIRPSDEQTDGGSREMVHAAAGHR